MHNNIYNKIKKEYKRFINREFKKLFGNYEPHVEKNVWSDVWKEYYIENKNDIDNKFKKLLFGLDKKSIKCAQDVFKRYIFLYPKQEFKDSFLYKVEDFYSEQDLKDQKKGIEIDKEQFKLPEGIYYESSIFKYAHGLNLIPQDRLDEIKNLDIIDAGAYVGDSAICMNQYTGGKVHSFEPEQNNYELLLKTLRGF